MQALSYWVRRDIPLAERTAAATRIVEWADVLHGMGQLAGIELRELISFVSSLPPREDRDSPSPYRPTATREPKFDVTLGILILRFSSESVSILYSFVELCLTSNSDPRIYCPEHHQLS